MKREKYETLPIAQAYLDRMAQTQQNPRFHAEGSVLDHTLMVVSKFFELKDRYHLTPEQEKILYWAAVLHDIGKPEVTQYVDGRWKSPDHEKAGIPIAREILLAQPDISTEQRQQILALIRWHGFPLHWAMQNQPDELLKALNLKVDLKLLSIFSQFDFHGRICEDQESTLNLIQRFMELDVARVEYEMGTHQNLMTQYNSWNRKKKNAAWSAVRLGRMALLEKLLDAEPNPAFNYDQLMGQVGPSRKIVMTVGPSMTGKTTWLKSQFPSDTFLIHLKDFHLTEEQVIDDYNTSRRMVEFKYHLSLYIRQFETILIDGRNLNENLRFQITEAARNLHSDIEYVVFENSLETALELNKNQENPLSEEEIRSQYAAFDLLHPWESHSMRFITPQMVAEPRK